MGHVEGRLQSINSALREAKQGSAADGQQEWQPGWRTKGQQVGSGYTLRGAFCVPGAGAALFLTLLVLAGAADLGRLGDGALRMAGAEGP